MSPPRRSEERAARLDGKGAKTVGQPRQPAGGPEAEVALIAQRNAVDQDRVAGLVVPAPVGVVQGTAVDIAQVVRRTLRNEAVGVPVLIAGVVVVVLGDTPLKGDIVVGSSVGRLFACRFGSLNGKAHLERFDRPGGAPRIGEAVHHANVIVAPLEADTALGVAGESAVLDQKIV